VPPRKAYPLRIDPALYGVIERWAADEMRSVNGQIEFLLREAARRAGRLPRRPPAGGGSGGPAASPGDGAGSDAGRGAEGDTGGDRPRA
jgi:hypothetical protein